jgi:putative membrane protein
VFALDDDRVVRILQPGGRIEDIIRRQDLVAELSHARPPFALPDVLEVGELAGRVFAVERRLPGRSVLHELQSTDGPARQHLVERHLEAAAALGDLSLEPRHTFGELIGDDVITTSSWRAYLTERAEITPVVNASDIDVTMSWLRSAGLHEWFEPARRWLAAFWSVAVDEPTLHRWCRHVLLDHG